MGGSSARAPSAAGARTGPSSLQLKFHRLERPGRASCPAATSRRSCSASGWPPSPKVLIIDEPTRGIDVGTKAEVHRLMSELAARRARGADDLLRAARGARHGRPRAGHARGAARRRSSRAPRPTRSRVVRAATAELEATPHERSTTPRPPPRRGAQRGGRQDLVDRVCACASSSLVGVLVMLVLGHDARQLALPQQPEPARHPAQRRDPGAARGRPDGRRRHAQHRPVGRLGARHHARSPTGVLFADHHGIPIALVVVLGIAVGAGFGLINGALVALGRVPVAGGHARHALRHPRHRLRLGHGPPDQRRRLPDGFLNLGTDTIAGRPVPRR